MAATKTASVIEHCRVAPPPGTVVEQSLPLTFFDLPWLGLSTPLQVLYFHEFRHPKTHFMDTVIPNLKHSLSLTLQHFFPLAGTLMLPSPPGKPTIRYADGDSVSLTFAESTADFNHLAGYHPRNAHDFYHLLPQLPPVTKLSDSDTIVTPLVAIQVTLSPNQGLCFGFTYWHTLADGSAFVDFIKAWASISKLGGEKGLLAMGSLPFHDRSAIRDPKGLESIYLSHVSKHVKCEYYKTETQIPTNKVRATFLMTRHYIQRLKLQLVSAPRLPLHVSTFSVICAYLWICMIKLRAATMEEAEAEYEWEHMIIPMDCRRRLDPPIPDTYFGNCLVHCFATAKHADLSGKEGLAAAAESIGDGIRSRINSGEAEGVLKGLEKWLSSYDNLKPERIVGIAGSPRLSDYETDFGFGRPRKSEIMSIDTTGTICIGDCRDSKGDVEISVSFPDFIMNAFAAIYCGGLAKII